MSTSHALDCSHFDAFLWLLLFLLFFCSLLLGELDLSQNLLSATIPTFLGNISGLELLRLEANDLTGSIDQAICSLRGVNLTTLIVDCVEASVEVTCTCCSSCGLTPSDNADQRDGG